MLQQPIDVLKLYPIRKSKKQKTAFRADVQTYAQSLGYAVKLENGSMSARNIVIGEPERARYLITAHYDTPAGLLIPNLITPCNFFTFLLYQLAVVALFVIAAIGTGVVVGLLTDNTQLASFSAMVLYWLLLVLMLVGPANKNNANDNTSGVVTLLEIARSLPENQRSKVCFVLFDLEEAGLVGSSSYRKTHKSASDNQIVLNLDCVGDGNELVFFPMKKLCKDERKLSALLSCQGKWGEKSIAVCHKGFRTYPSDQKHFPYGVGIAAFRRSRCGVLYCSRIHTKRDTILEESNVNILRAALISYISNDRETVQQPVK